MGRWADPRPARVSEIAALRDLALRSKAHWGYDAGFMAACEEELTLTSDEFGSSSIAMIDGASGPVGLVQVAADGRTAHLLKLFVAPEVMGSGLGRRLFKWAVDRARDADATEMTIESDPDAVPFYSRLGATQTGSVPSGSIPGRTLPRLVLDLRHD